MQSNALPATPDNVIYPPRFSEMPTEDIEPKPSWFRQRLMDIGVLMAPHTEAKPPGFFVNWTSLSAIVVIVGAIAGLWWFTWQQGQALGYERGKAEAEKQQILDRLTLAEAEAKKAKDTALINKRNGDTK